MLKLERNKYDLLNQEYEDMMLGNQCIVNQKDEIILKLNYQIEDLKDQIKEINLNLVCNNSDKINIEDFKKKIDEQDYRIVCLSTNLEKQSLYINTLKKLICEKEEYNKKLH